MLQGLHTFQIFPNSLHYLAVIWQPTGPKVVLDSYISRFCMFLSLGFKLSGTVKKRTAVTYHRVTCAKFVRSSCESRVPGDGDGLSFGAWHCDVQMKKLQTDQTA